MAQAITEATFEQEVLKSEVPVLVDFWAPWCGPCQVMGPLVDELATEFEASKAKVVKVNVDEDGALAGKYEILSIPSFLVFKGGEVVETVVGGVPKEKLKEALDKHTV